MRTTQLPKPDTETQIDTFEGFAALIGQRFTEMSQGELFLVDGKDTIFDHYLAAYPMGTNPIYLVRTEHDCSTCKQFIRNLGRVVAIKDGEIQTVWSVENLATPYREVAMAMDAFVRAQPIVSLFRTKETSFGTASTVQLLDSGATKRWNHLSGRVDPRHRSNTPDAAMGEYNTAVQVFRRGLTEITPESLQTILDLIESNSIYRGEEKLKLVRDFRDAQRAYNDLPSELQENWLWMNASNPAIARFRNDVIGTLAQDLSEGVDLDRAVRAFETKVAPTNYKRTTALITPRMVQDAMKTLDELGLEPTLHRRLATIGDISVNNVLWVDRAVRTQMRGGGIAEILMDATTTGRSSSGKATDVGIDYFMAEILPTAQSIDLHLSNAHLANFVTLTAPENPDTGKLFRWNNDFAWSYDGNITDSIKEKVKAAGGNVTAKVRFSLAWFNYDDLDLHVVEPDGNHIYYMMPRGRSGFLDVDMNAGGRMSQTPVENVAFERPIDGTYKVYVHQFNQRATTNIGFSMEIAGLNGVTQLSYPKMVAGNVQVGTFEVKNSVIVEAKFGEGIVGNGVPQSKWGLRTESPVKVETVMYSPNFWDDNHVGNRHVFFMLAGCHTEEPMRGIYNEFLSPELDKHRKVFEVLGDRTKCPPTEQQLSGVGFSSTRGDTVTLSVKTDKGTRLYNVAF